MNGVDLNAVNACVHELLRGLCKCLDLIVDLLDGHGAGFDLVIPAVRRCGSGSGYVVKVGYRACELAENGVLEQSYHGLCYSHRAAHACCQLDKELGAGLVELDHVLLKVFEHLVVLIQPAAADGILDALHAGQDQADAVLRAVEQEVCRFLVEVARLHPAEQGRSAHRALNYSVRYLDIADLPGCK